MSGYEELGRAIEEKDRERGEETDHARNFAMRLVSEFQKHLGAPEDCIHLRPAADVLRSRHAHSTIGECVESYGAGYTVGLEIDFPDYVTGVRMKICPNGSGWKVSVDGTGISETITPQKDWQPFVVAVADHLRKGVSRHAPPEVVAFRSR